MKIFKDKLLFFLTCNMIINIVIILFFGASSNLRIFPLIINMIFLVFCKESEILPLLFFTHANFGLYDSFNFKYFFNITVVICSLKLLFIYKKDSCINKRDLLCLILLFVYNIILIFYNEIDIKVLPTYISLFMSYIILFIYSNKLKFDFQKIYKYYSIGMILGVLCALALIYNSYGLEFPVGYRFCGLMRDPNGYSLELLFLIITAPIYGSITKKPYFFYILIFVIFALLGISKMFLISIILVILIYLFYYIKNLNYKKTINFKKTIFMFIIICFTIIVFSKFHILEKTINNYSLRFNITEITSGRGEINRYYINLMLDNPNILFFGKSLEYYRIIGWRGWAMVHNTWLEILLSFGLFGGILYCIMIKNVFYNKKTRYFKNYSISYKILFIIFSLCLLSLSELSGDVFAILILFLIIVRNEDCKISFKKKYSERDKCNEKD